MECKFCHAQMEEGTTLCPVCGKDNTEEAEATAPQEETAEKVVTEAAAEMEAPETEDSAEGTEPSADPAEEAATVKRLLPVFFSRSRSVMEPSGAVSVRLLPSPPVW